MISGKGCLNAASFCSMGWFERKLIVVSVVVGLWYTSISSLDVSRIFSRSRKLIHLLFSYAGLSCMSVYIWFMYILIRSGCVLVVSNTISISST